MDQDVFDMTDPGYRDLARRLEAFADLRLSPSAAATARMRSAVMHAAHGRAALIATGAASGVAGTSERPSSIERGSASWRAWRRPAAALLAATLTVGLLAGTTFASRPGGPLYAARIWVEMANLPADPVARAEAEATRLDARLEEAEEASAAGDIPAAEAALAAYSTIVAEATEASAGNATATAEIQVAVARHVIVLTLLVDTVPAAARDAVEHALTSSTKVLDDIDRAGGADGADPSHPAQPVTPGAGNDPAGAGTGPAGAGNGPAGARGAGPDRSADPADPATGGGPQKSAAPARTGGQKAQDPNKPAGGTGPSPAPARSNKPSDPPGGDSHPAAGDKATQ
jgi:hypothetical protein